jgi:hypothetical protein
VTSRAALAEVLATLTTETDATWWRMMTTDYETRHVAAGIEWRIAGKWAPLRSWRREPETRWSPLRMTTPAEAVEALATARLWPWEPGDDPTRWWCPGCAGNGRLIPTPGFSGAPCPQCYGDDTRPPSLPAIVAVASLGASSLVAAVELAGEIARAAGCEGAGVVWRVMTREAIDLWARCGDDRRSGEGPVTIAQAACLASVDWGSADRVWGRDYWSGAAPWWLSDAGGVIAYAWPMLRDLAAGGVHLVALDASRIVLAVEAL